MLAVTPGSVLADRYVVGERIGVGGSGSVWRAHDRVLDRPVAVKVVPSGVAASRLAREARATAGIGVRNVVAVYDVGEQDGAHFLVMELVDGVDLATMLAATGPLPPELVALVGHDVARGVAAVHAAELVHRDVSPANVLVTTDGEVKLTDLGIAQRTDHEATRRLTQAGTVVGTVDYLAPEQVEGRDVTAASDVYALGLLLHAAATGRAPFGEGSVSERLARRLATDPADLGADHGEVGGIIARAVQRDPADRWSDGEELRAALAPHLPADEHPLRRELADRVAQARAAGPGAGPDRTDALEGIAIGQHRTGTAAAAAPATPTQTPAEPAEPARPAAPAAAPAEPARGDATRAIPTSWPDQRASSDDDTGPQAAVGAAAGAAGAADGAAADRPTEVVPTPSSTDDGPGIRLAGPLVGAVVVLLLVVAGASGLLTGEDGDDGRGGDVEQEPATTEVAIVEADDHDPLGGGDEHPEDVPLAVDGDADTEWDTEGYDSADLGGLKDGVGLLLDLGEVTEVAAVEVVMGIDGADMVVTVSEERPEGDPTGSGTVLGTVEGTSGTVTVQGEPVAGRWVTLWFTSLGDDGRRHRAAVREVRVLGP